MNKEPVTVPRIEAYARGLFLQEQHALMRLGDPELDVEQRVHLHRLIIRLREERNEVERSLGSSARR